MRAYILIALSRL
jgi:hypothetical protein